MRNASASIVVVTVAADLLATCRQTDRMLLCPSGGLSRIRSVIDMVKSSGRRAFVSSHFGGIALPSPRITSVSLGGWEQPGSTWCLFVS